MNPVFLAILAYAWWGLVPIYWKQLPDFPAEELILFRILFSLLSLLPIMLFRRELRAFLEILRSPKSAASCLIASLLIGFNWYLYIWAIAHHRVVESSLGYFLNPLVNMALGTILLKEKMNRTQQVSCALAGFGTGILTWQSGSLPWLSILLALSFGLYGLARKIFRFPTLPATVAETSLLAIPALICLVSLSTRQGLHLSQAPPREILWLSLSGLITTVPLLAFAEAAKHLPLTYMGLLQFISPTAQFLLGVFVYEEPFQTNRWFSFSAIWLGLLLFLLDIHRRSVLARRPFF